MQDLADEIPGIDASFTRIIGQAIFASGSKTVGGQFMAIDPAREEKQYNFYLKYIEQGHLFSESESGGIIVGAKLADKLNLRLKKKVVYTLTDKNGEIVSAVARVSGIFRSGDDSIDGSTALLPLKKVRKILHYTENEASLIALFIDDQRQAATLASQAARILNDNTIQVLTYKDTQKEIAGLIAMDRASNYFLQFLVGLLIAAGILNTILMSVMERTKEFGMMMAVGMSPNKIIAIVLIESFWIGFFGLILGAFITLPIYVYMNRIGLDLTSYIGTDYNAAGVLVDPVLKFFLFKESALVIIAMIFAFTMAAGLYPAMRAGRINPVDSLKTM
jgi:ABC-type lipoprotein release transport system permease subunit